MIEALQQEGYRVWFDTGLELGDQYNDVIAKHIEECEVFMALLTEDYYQSPYCHMELNYAKEDCGQRIIPVYLGNAKQIKKNMPSGMKMWLSGTNAFQMDETIDTDQFMNEVNGTQLLASCRDISYYAGKQPSPEECYTKGEQYYYEDNYAEAVKWYRLAAEQGYAMAQNNLGLMYRSVQGVEQNESEAVKWFGLAAKQGNENAKNALKQKP